MLSMKRMTAVAAAAALASGCVMFHLADTGIKHSMLVHAASIDDLTFSIEGKSLFAVTTSQDEGAWETSVEKYAVLKKCNIYAAGEIEIPSEYNGFPVMRIATYAFSKCYDLTEIIIPDSVESIGAGAFNECEGLVSVNLPSGLKAINGSTFSGCKSLTHISIPESVETIYGGAFRYCEKLTEISIPDSVIQFNASSYSGVFDGCIGLKKVTLSSNLKEIPQGTFSGCSGLESFTIPNGVQLVADEVFKDCKSLKEVTFSESVTNIRKNVFRSCNALQSVIIQNPNCVLHDFNTLGSSYSFKPTIYGIAGSTAETYANEHNLTFKPLDDTPKPPEQPENTLPLAPEGSVFGDVDGDKDITAADAQYVLQFYVEKMTGNTPTWYSITGNVNAPA